MASNLTDISFMEQIIFLENQDDYECISKQYFIFGEHDIGWFYMRKSDGSFWELDKPSGREMQ